ncbi:MAG: hypothetical protein IJ489_08865 [Clostridia bacterium]|nr:hypothetical protein [Clostridia bacterium]
MYHEWTDDFGDRYAVGSGYVYQPYGRNPVLVGDSKRKSISYARFSVCVSSHKEANAEPVRKFVNVTIYATEINRTLFALAKKLRNFQRIFFWGPVYCYKNQEGLMSMDVSAEGFFITDALAEIQLGEHAPEIQKKDLYPAKADAFYDKIYPF